MFDILASRPDYDVKRAKKASFLANLSAMVLALQTPVKDTDSMIHPLVSELASFLTPLVLFQIQSRVPSTVEPRTVRAAGARPVLHLPPRLT